MTEIRSGIDFEIPRSVILSKMLRWYLLSQYNLNVFLITEITKFLF